MLGMFVGRGASGPTGPANGETRYGISLSIRLTVLEEEALY